MEFLMPNFNEYLLEFKKFSDREGHCNVPFGYKTDDGSRLDVWVSSQRRHTKRLTAKRFAQLTLAGFVWDPWEKTFKLFKQFYEREGHCDVPMKYVTDGYQLGHWVRFQRMNQNRLTIFQIGRLKTLGDWDCWEEGFNHLQEFHNRKGHCNVPAGLMQNRFHLGSWVKLQRTNQFLLATDRVEKLKMLDFIWDLWGETFEQLKQFHAREGHCNVPLRYSVNGFQLGRWVRVQRERQSKLSEEQLTWLAALSFEYKKIINASNDQLWVAKLLLVATDDEWCVKMNCTTCGAGQFRTALKECLDPASVFYPLKNRMYLTKHEAISTLDGLSLLAERPSLNLLGATRETLINHHRRTIMLMLYQSWIALGEQTTHGEMKAILGETLAGKVLNEMIAHRRKRHTLQG
jgi:hypothetical protein